MTDLDTKQVGINMKKPKDASAIPIVTLNGVIGMSELNTDLMRVYLEGNWKLQEETLEISK